jgi:hypothetical protein
VKEKRLTDEEVDKMFRELSLREQFGAFVYPHYNITTFEMTCTGEEYCKYLDDVYNRNRPLRRHYLEEKMKKKRPGFLRRIFSFTDLAV